MREVFSIKENLMNKLLTAMLGAVMVSAVAVSSVQATGMGQIEGGDIYRVKNVTKGTDFSDPTSATCNETVQFKVRIHNPGPSAIDNVKVVATLPNAVATSHVSRVTVSSTNADPLSTSDTATVNLDKAAVLSYVAGSTELLDARGSKVSTLNDAITGAGVTIGKVGVSVDEKRFVQFSAKINCPEAPKNIEVCELATKKIITIREDQFDSSKHSKNLNDCKVVVKYIKVCELASKNIITIDEKAYDATKHSKNLADCAAKPPVEGEIVVCETATKNIVTIKESAFDSSKYTKDLSECAEAPVVVTELPRTGTNGVIAVVASLMAAAAGYVVTARKNLLG